MTEQTYDPLKFGRVALGGGQGQSGPAENTESPETPEDLLFGSDASIVPDHSGQAGSSAAVDGDDTGWEPLVDKQPELPVVPDSRLEELISEEPPLPEPARASLPLAEEAPDLVPGEQLQTTPLGEPAAADPPGQSVQPEQPERRVKEALPGRGAAVPRQSRPMVIPSSPMALIGPLLALLLGLGVGAYMGLAVGNLVLAWVAVCLGLTGAPLVYILLKNG